uniref:DAO domain-containing protein n=1 Tax=Elaeophora elaphi TaxID=1147741 RepID=A0A0R3RQV8_9BILA
MTGEIRFLKRLYFLLECSSVRQGRIGSLLRQDCYPFCMGGMATCRLNCLIKHTSGYCQQKHNVHVRHGKNKTHVADVVVAGGGIVGTSIAYHLARRGKLVALLERNRVGLSGATSLSAGLVTAPMHWQDPSKQYMAKYSLDLYADLCQTSNFRYNRCGRMYLTNTPEGEVSLRRMFSRSTIYEEEAQLYNSPEEMRRWFPKSVSTDGISLALFSPNDVALDPVGLCQALGKRGRDNGVQILEHCFVEEITVDKKQNVVGVHTNQGQFETGCYVDATGIWCGTSRVHKLPARHVIVAAHPATYTYLSTKRLPDKNIKNNIPSTVFIFTHVDEKTYLFMDESRTLCAGFTQNDFRSLSRPRVLGQWTVPPPDWDKFYPTLNHLLHRCNILGETECGELICSAESYTVDKEAVIGETAQIQGYYVATGFSGQGLALAGGAGNLVAGLICGETLPVDITRLEVTRFIDLHASPQYLIERVPEVAARLFTNSYEYHQYQTARNLRTSPIYHQLKKAGAVFGEVMGYERPLWYAEENAEDTSLSFYSGQFSLVGRPEWFGLVAREYNACRERVGLIDLSSFVKFNIEGPNSVEFLQYLCSGNIDVPVGSVVYTGMQNEQGGFVSDCAISRLEEDKFFAIVPPIQQLRFHIWLKKWMKKLGHKILIEDVTGHYTVLDVVGPSSRALMEKLTGESMSRCDFPSFSIREISIGMATGIRALSLTHSGELEWEMYIPNEVVQNVYERLMERGKEYGIMRAGYYALRQLRIEKFFVCWGEDISTHVTPLECGRTYRVDFNKDFIGKDALLEQKRSGIRKRFVQLLVGNHDLDHDPWPQGGELIYRFGEPVGRTTSAAYGYTLNCQVIFFGTIINYMHSSTPVFQRYSVCIGYIESKQKLTVEYIKNGSYQLDIAGKFFPVQINLFTPSLPMTSSEQPDHYRPTQDGGNCL